MNELEKDLHIQFMELWIYDLLAEIGNYEIIMRILDRSSPFQNPPQKPYQPINPNPWDTVPIWNKPYVVD